MSNRINRMNIISVIKFHDARNHCDNELLFIVIRDFLLSQSPNIRSNNYYICKFTLL